MVARRAHNPKVVGSNPAPATKYYKARLKGLAFLFSGYDPDKKSVGLKLVIPGKVVGSNPAPATKYYKARPKCLAFLFSGYKSAGKKRTQTGSKVEDCKFVINFVSIRVCVAEISCFAVTLTL